MNHWTTLWSLAFVTPTTLLAAAPARASQSPTEQASPPASFGEARQLVVAGGSSANLEHSSGPGNTTFLAISPSADVFVLGGVSVGGRVAYSHQTTTGEPTLDAISVGPRIGYNLSLGDHFSLWPTVSVAFGQTASSGLEDHWIEVGANLPLLYHPASHFFIGFGPSFSTVVVNVDAGSNQPRTTQYALTFAVGGWVAL